MCLVPSYKIHSLVFWFPLALALAVALLNDYQHAHSAAVFKPGRQTNQIMPKYIS